MPAGLPSPNHLPCLPSHSHPLLQCKDAAVFTKARKREKRRKRAGQLYLLGKENVGFSSDVAAPQPQITTSYDQNHLLLLPVIWPDYSAAGISGICSWGEKWEGIQWKTWFLMMVLYHPIQEAQLQIWKSRSPLSYHQPSSRRISRQA